MCVSVGTQTDKKINKQINKKKKKMVSVYIYNGLDIGLYSLYNIQLTLVISTSLISNNRLSRSENLVPA